MGGFSYPDEFVYESDVFLDAADMEAAGIFFAVYFLFLFVAMAFSIVSYVLYSIGLHSLANSRGIRHGWLAWLPFGNLWILGSISDQYQYVVKGNVRNRRKLLLGLDIGLVAVCIGWLIAIAVSLILSEGIASDKVVSVLLTLLGYLAVLTIAIVTVVYVYMCLYDLYHSCNPDHAAVFLVLSVLISVTMPFFVFACRKKELGMPPRKQPVPQPVFEVPEEVPVTEEGYAQPEEFEE